MDIYDHPTFRMASQQFELVADHLEISKPDRARLKYPKRSMTVALPIRRDDGNIEVFAATVCNTTSRSGRPKAVCGITRM
jgi:glutamate dehydrogenase (NAD(P)+)